MLSLTALPFDRLKGYINAGYTAYHLTPDQAMPTLLSGQLNPPSLQRLQELLQAGELLSFQVQLKPLASIRLEDLRACLAFNRLRQDVMFEAAMKRVFAKGSLPQALQGQVIAGYLQAQCYYVPGSLAPEWVQLTD
jgi:hypothetical protein